MTLRHHLTTRSARRVLAATSTALLLAAAAAVTTPLVASATAPTPMAAQTPSCGIVWGSLDRSAGTLSPGAAVTGLRTGRHACFDRLVVDLRGPLQGYAVGYVDVVRADGSGQPVPVRGGASLHVVARAASNDNVTGAPTYLPADPRELSDVTGYATLRQISSAGAFEGVTSFAVGVRARLPFRVFVLDGPSTGSRLVVDVAHHW